MLVTFKTSAYADITMFGTAAVPLLKMMGQSGNVPGAIMAEDIGPALDTLRKALEAQSGTDTRQPADAGSSGAGLIGPDGSGHPDVDDDQLEPVSLSARANPLITLLESARDAGQSVTWTE